MVENAGKILAEVGSLDNPSLTRAFPEL